MATLTSCHHASLVSPEGKYERYQPRVQLINPPRPTLVRFWVGHYECIGRFTLQHTDPRQLADDPTIFGKDICSPRPTSKSPWDTTDSSRYLQQVGGHASSWQICCHTFRA